MAGEERRNEIREIHRTYKSFYVVTSIAVALGVVIFIGAAVFAEDAIGYAMNLVTEGFGVAVSVVITVFVIDRIYDRRAEERQTEELKRRLVREAGSRSNDLAIVAIDELQNRGWLEGDNSLLKEVDLYKAELQKANLSYCNLVRTVFYMANLQEANLAGSNLYEALFDNANLQRAQLLGADLRNAHLSQAKLQDSELYETNLTGAALIGTQFQRAFLDATELRGADLRYADFTDATMTHADLRGADVMDANFTGANLMGARLPDGSFGSAAEMERFTNRYHPKFAETLKEINELRKSLDLEPIPSH